MTENFLTIKELSAKLRLTDKTIKKLRDEGRIPFQKLGHSVRFVESHVLEALGKKEVQNV